LERLVLVTMRERPRACTRQVLLHGDLNPTNVLAAQREPWLAIDPKPMVGDPAFDGPRLVTQPDPASTADPAATLRRRLDIVHDVMRADRDALALWCLADTLQMGATARWHDDLAAARRFAALVALVAAEIS
jgi:streptomycin 6-kinase